MLPYNFTYMELMSCILQESCHELLLQLAEADLAALPDTRQTAVRLLGMLPTCPARMAALQVCQPHQYCLGCMHTCALLRIMCPAASTPLICCHMQAALVHASPAEQLKLALHGSAASGTAMRPARLLYHLEVHTSYVVICWLCRMCRGFNLHLGC